MRVVDEGINSRRWGFRGPYKGYLTTVWTLTLFRRLGTIYWPKTKKLSWQMFWISEKIYGRRVEEVGSWILWARPSSTCLSWEINMPAGTGDMHSVCEAWCLMKGSKTQRHQGCTAILLTLQESPRAWLLIEGRGPQLSCNIEGRLLPLWFPCWRST